MTMITQIDLKTLAAKKNSVIVGRMFIVHLLETNDLTSIIVSISAVLLQIVKEILSTTTNCAKKMLPIIDNPQKQTP